MTIIDIINEAIKATNDHLDSLIKAKAMIEASPVAYLNYGESGIRSNVLRTTPTHHHNEERVRLMPD